MKEVVLYRTMPIINRQYLGPVYPNRPRLSLKNFGRDAEVQNIHRDFEALQLEMMDSSTAFIDGDDPYGRLDTIPRDN